jgi:hypothetical protein
MERSVTGGLTEKQIKQFLNKNIENSGFRKCDVRAIFRRLRLPNRTISYVDLLNALFPVCAKENKYAKLERIKEEIVSHIDKTRKIKIKTIVPNFSPNRTIDIKIPSSPFTSEVV